MTCWILRSPLARNSNGLPRDRECGLFSGRELAIDVQIFNCLPATLAHYSNELVDTLTRLGARTRVVESTVALDSSRSHVVRAASHLRDVRTLTKTPANTIVIWPALGWFEGALWGRNSARAIVVAHDPVPIRKQAFSGTTTTALAARVMSAEWLCHTEMACEAATEAIGVLPLMALHPVLSKSSSPPKRRQSARRVVSVLGQYKPSRSLDVLQQISSTLSSGEFDLRIIGRGWPRVNGWRVTNRFVTEGELDMALDESSAVVIPYKRYWQSGIAVRAVERGAQIVGEETEFLTRLVGRDYDGIVDSRLGRSWVDAIHAVTAPEFDAGDLHARYIREVDASWSTILESLNA